MQLFVYKMTWLDGSFHDVTASSFDVAMTKDGYVVLRRWYQNFKGQHSPLTS